MMIDEMNCSQNDTQQSDIYCPVPAARPLNDFAHEWVGEEVVLFDDETQRYYTLNRQAITIWTACDGTVSIATIAQVTHLPVEVVEETIAQLGSGNMLRSSSWNWNTPVDRRRASRMIAAGLAGVVGLPVIESIIAPDAASAQSGGKTTDGSSGQYELNPGGSGGATTDPPGGPSNPPEIITGGSGGTTSNDDGTGDNTLTPP